MVQGARVGLTGGIGSGKSTVARMWGSAGAYCIDADAIARSVTAPGGAAIPLIQQTFGTHLIDPHGALDRQAMRALVFRDASARATLEAIIHPLVGAAMEAAACEADTLGARCVVYDIPLLVESGHWRHKLDAVVVIDCHENTQIARVMQRSQLAPQDVQSIMAAQASRTQRLAAADAVIFNDGVTLLELECLSKQIAKQFGL